MHISVYLFAVIIITCLFWLIKFSLATNCKKSFSIVSIVVYFRFSCIFCSLEAYSCIFLKPLIMLITWIEHYQNLAYLMLLFFRCLCAALVSGMMLGITNPTLGCLAHRFSLSRFSTFGIFIISGKWKYFLSFIIVHHIADIHSMLFMIQGLCWEAEKLVQL